MPRKSKRRKTLETRSKDEGKSEISILDLPSEITLKILRYLDSKCLLKSVSLVCKAWNKLAFDRSLWETVSLNLQNCEREGLINILKKFPHVQHLAFNEGYIGDTILREISKLTNLQTLSISDCCSHYCNRRCSRFCDEISPSYFNQNDENDKYKNFDLKQIKQLKIYGPNMSLRFFKALLNKCSEVRDISFYYRNRNFPSDNDMLKIDSIFFICADTLENFYLDGIFGAYHCLKGISKCVKLKKLHVEDCFNYKDEMLFEIMRLSNLTDLSLSNALRFTADGINKMFDEGKLSNLIKLTLDRIIYFKNINLKTIANNCQKLQVFNISYCNGVTDQGISFIVKKCSNIKDLSIKQFHVKGSFLLDINDNILKNLRTLEVQKEVYESEFLTSLRNTRLDLNIMVAKSYA